MKMMKKYIKKYRHKKNSDSLSFRALRDFVVTESNFKDGLFNAEWYNSAYPDVPQEGQDPFYHYLNHGHMEGRNPGPLFDTDFYKEKYPDVVAAGINPLVHYLQTGRAEGRSPNAKMVASGHGSEVRHTIVKEMSFDGAGEAAVLVTHAPAGRLKPHVLPHMELLRSNGISVLLVAVVDRPLELTATEIAAATGIIVRDNAGYDFGAWAHALKIEPALFGASLLLITNDSIIPTANSSAFRTMIERIRRSTADVVGLTASHEYGWHISSYFLALKPKALSSWAFQHFVRDIKYLGDKDEVIRTYEVPFAAKMQGAGLKVEAIYTGAFSSNPTLFSWRELIAQDFPYVKLLLLRKQFSEIVDWPEAIKGALKDLHEGWPEALKEAGFDIDLVRASIRAADFSDVPRGNSTELLVDARQFEPITENHTLRVAYFGPWNYDNGLGAASRELLCSLRHTDVQINAYPITKSFHVHRLICPAVPVIDFAGRPDIAIVHLNPDSWHLLSNEQREIIRSAKQRIGYWVWETDILPPAWKHDLHSVDRIWAPSHYCADVFASDVQVPVDVVPHPVRIPAEIMSDRESILKRMGVDPSQRVILYIFDGASYLVRKNPEALIRAFALSGLGDRGWTLLLKVKHLYDRPEAGKALAALANATPGTKLADISLAADDVTSLLAASDIYASPHCSEGFGLTVAEAMAVGKPVVATDFGGTRDFLASDCGYPVLATHWTLGEDHGHYLKGHSWAKVDEEALAAALVQAAEAVASGDLRVGAAAKASIERQLSYASVAEAINASFAATINDSAIKSGHSRPTSRRKAVVTPPPAPEFAINPKAGVKFEDVNFTSGIIPIALSDELSWDGPPLPDGDPDDWLFFAPGGARVHSDADRLIMAATAQRPDVALFYADDAATTEETLERIRLKPDFNWTLLVAQDYIGMPVIIRRKTLIEVGGLTNELGSAALYDLVLRVAEAGRTIARIPEVLLVHTGKRPVADVAARRTALVARNSLHDIDLVDGATPNLLLQRRRFSEGEHPSVTILIPTNRTRRPGMEETYIEHLLGCISLADWPLNKITVIVGDNEVNEPWWATKSWPFRLLRVTTPEHSGEQFNYAGKANLLWRMATDEYIVLMNDDAAPNNSGWLKALMGFLIDQNVGCVGGQLFYEDGSIQHAGMFPSLRTVVHAWLDWPTDAKTYQDWAHAQREWSMITGAIFATRRSILDRVGGFDERFSLEFNDVDLCLRIRNLGYRVVYNPDAQFTHAEKASRGETAPPGAEVALFLSRWSEWLTQDPASHPGFAKNRIDPVPVPSPNAWFLK
ncbi:glycosyltransferase [Sphingobium fuliginis]|uniref:Glycosyltransferase n=1 Tax=Sphingobium fuliginis ATCC 27551 TaxID=1208342 RepID=A0A5B8CLP0_SPHSA|nr:glycosyltransferase [Sphingobium fuliginis]QDC38071.1 glycosyltransferase [Sphingobium fuliginis ATCC 27551]